MMRRADATLMGTLVMDGKLVGDQHGYSSLTVQFRCESELYAPSPVESRLDTVNKLESLLVM
jgi:hypothetical protein